jgi:glycosyltransferase involved in cell wall biosynthesis
MANGHLCRENEEKFQLAARHLARTGGVVVSRTPLEVGHWSDALASILQPLLAVARGGSIKPQAPCYVLNTDADPIALVPSWDDSLQVHSVIFLAPRARVSLFTLRRWLRHYVQEFWFYEAGGWHRLDAADAFPLPYRLARRIRRFASFPPRIAAAATKALLAWKRSCQAREHAQSTSTTGYSPEDLSGWRRWIDRDNRRLAKERQPIGEGPLRVTHYIGALFCGGAERQMCNLAVGLQERGHTVRVLSGYPPRGEAGHYLPLLKEHGILARAAELRVLPCRARQVLQGNLLSVVPAEIRGFVAFLFAELLDDKPEVLHCWLDQDNIIGAIAGLLAGVPRIVLSIRNSIPTHFPRFYRPFKFPWYQLLVRSRRIQFVSNSHSGAASYAAWLEFPKKQIRVVPNGLRQDQFPVPTFGHRQAARSLFGLRPEHKVICGLFRFHEQKQPEMFLQVIQQAAAQVQGLRVLIAGVGELEERMRQIIEHNQMGSYVQMLGRRQDVDQILLASDVLLLTSTLEGCPNVAIEAQSLGVPVVATAAGGTCETVIHGRTGLLAAVHDVKQLTHYLATVLNDTAWRLRLGAAGRPFVALHFDCDRMVDQFIQVYKQSLKSTID